MGVDVHNTMVRKCSYSILIATNFLFSTLQSKQYRPLLNDSTHSRRMDAASALLGCGPKRYSSQHDVQLCAWRTVRLGVVHCRVCSRWFHRTGSLTAGVFFKLHFQGLVVCGSRMESQMTVFVLPGCGIEGCRASHHVDQTRIQRNGIGWLRCSAIIRWSDHASIRCGFPY